MLDYGIICPFTRLFGCMSFIKTLRVLQKTDARFRAEKMVID